jgi:predicted amidohydrolase
MRVRIASVQYHLRRVRDFEEFEDQVHYVLTAASEYKPHFVLLPELFTIQLMSFIDSSDPVKAIDELSTYKQKYVDLLKSYAVNCKYYLVGGTHPTKENNKIFNRAYLFTPEGKIFTQDKVHRTRWEKDPWEIERGSELKVFKTIHCPISILICYDVEFPEVARVVADAGAEIIFVPSYTDDRQGYFCQARAIENQVYVVMASTVGILPVENLRLHYGQANIFTPSDFPFSRDGIAAEGVINQEQIIIADLELDLLDENRIKGTTIPLMDKRNDIYSKVATIENTQ